MLLDPVLFAHSLGIAPDPWQLDVLRSRSKRIILNCSRQTGKSTVTAILAQHHALYTPNAMVIIISHTQLQAAETFKKVVSFYRHLGRPVPARTESAYRLELANGSRIISLSGQRPDSIRGYSGVSLLIMDEAAQVLDETYHVARPMLAVSEGRIILLSTPHGKRGFFYDAWFEEDKWEKVQLSAYDCPRLTQEFLESERTIFPEWFFKQEYENYFAHNVTSLFSEEAVERAFDHEEDPWDLDLGI